MKRRKARIVVTLGPASLHSAALRALRARGVDFVRTNMSHSSIAYLERAIAAARREGLPFIIDTEGSQVRSGDLEEEAVHFHEHDEVRLWSGPKPGHRRGLQLTPPSILAELEEGDLLYVDFDTLVLRVTNVSTAGAGFVTARVVSGGWVGRNKGVVVDPIAPRRLRLPTLSEKDLQSIRIGLREGIEHIAVSFVRSAAAVDEVRAVTKGRMRIISKIECADALENLEDIIERSDMLLIDRGDLSKEIALERIPFVQKLIIREAAARGKGVFVATNLLETMVEKRKPTRAEVQDVVNTVLDGAAGLTLAAETAVGRFPIECVSMLDRLVEHAERVAPVTGVGPVVGPGYLDADDPWPSLPAPHGGRLISRVVPAPPETLLASLPVVRLNVTQQVALEMIAHGVYSPLDGFMGPEDLEAVISDMKLADGTDWPLPVLLDVPERVARDLPARGTIALAEETGRPIGLMELVATYSHDPGRIAAAVHGTTDRRHRGAAAMLACGPALLAGRVSLFGRRQTPTRQYELSPGQIRTLFQARGWRRVLGDWWMANDEDRSRRQRRALEKTSCDGLFVQVLVEGAPEARAASADVLCSCERAVKSVHCPDSVVMAALPGGLLPPGPRGMLLAALCRLNFGCTHALVDGDLATADRWRLERLERLGIEVVQAPKRSAPQHGSRNGRVSSSGCAKEPQEEPATDVVDVHAAQSIDHALLEVAIQDKK